MSKKVEPQTTPPYYVFTQTYGSLYKHIGAFSLLGNVILVLCINLERHGS